MQFLCLVIDVLYADNMSPLQMSAGLLILYVRMTGTHHHPFLIIQPDDFCLYGPA